MLIKYCTPCQFHDVKQKDQEEISYCRRESCYAQYSKCIAQKALKEFLARESRLKGSGLKGSELNSVAVKGV